MELLPLWDKKKTFQATLLVSLTASLQNVRLASPSFFKLYGGSLAIFKILHKQANTQNKKQIGAASTPVLSHPSGSHPRLVWTISQWLVR